VGNTILRTLSKKTAPNILRRFHVNTAKRITSTAKFTRALSRRTLGLSVLAGTLGVKEGIEGLRRGFGQKEKDISSNFFEDLTIATVLGGTVTTAAFLKGSGRNVATGKAIKRGFKFTAKRASSTIAKFLK
jgi:hypothetical protein